MSRRASRRDGIETTVTACVDVWGANYDDIEEMADTLSDAGAGSVEVTVCPAAAQIEFWFEPEDEGRLLDLAQELRTKVLATPEAQQALQVEQHRNAECRS